MRFFSGKKGLNTPQYSGMTDYNHPSLGVIRIVRSSRARRLSLSIRANGEVRLGIPPGVSDSEALRFLHEKEVWVVRSRERVIQRHPNQILDPTFSTRSHTLQLNPCACAEPSFRVAGGIVHINYPAHIRYDDPQVQATTQQGIEEAWRIEAKTYLPQRITILCKAFGFQCGAITVRNTRTRWGSCSGTDNLSLSLHLMKLPDPLIDYILLHELCHTRHKNHGVRFHALLNQVTQGKHPQLRQQLKSYSTRW